MSTTRAEPLRTNESIAPLPTFPGGLRTVMADNLTVALPEPDRQNRT